MANEDKRIIELPASESILNDDWIAKDSASQDTTRLQLSFLKQLCGGNNFAGEWHSGTVYNKEAYVTHEGKLYHNIKGGSVVAVDWSSSQWEQVSIGNELRKIVESLAPTFDTSTNYSVDDLVIYDNTLYRCIAAHTAGTWVGSHFGTVKVSSLLTYFIMDNFTDKQWEKYSGSPVNYTKGTVIHKGLTLYRCKANTTNQSWDSSKWEQVDVTDLLATEHGYIQSLFSIIAPTFSTSTSYNVDDFVIYNNQLYICVKPHRGSWYAPDFYSINIGDAIKSSYNNFAEVYNFTGNYVKGDIVSYSGVLLRCMVDNATTPFDYYEWEQVTVEQLIDEKVADVQIAGQTTTDENKISDLTSLAIEGTASGEIATFNDGSNLPMRSFICNITAQQDLHGQDAPWVGGAGKNKLFMTVDDIKATNGGVNTWTNNEKTINGITFTILTDNDNNVIGIKANGTASTTETVVNVFLQSAYFNLPTGQYIISGCTNGASNTYRLNVRKSGGIVKANYDGDSSFTLEENTDTRVTITINNGATVNNVIFYPMVRLATVTDATFAPYSNICPISGHTEVNATRCGKNLAELLSVGIYNTSTGVEQPLTNNNYAYSSKVKCSDTDVFTISSGWDMTQVIAYNWDAYGNYLGHTAPTLITVRKSTFSPKTNASYMAVAVRRQDNTSSLSDFPNFQLEYGVDVTTYEPYNGHTYNIQFKDGSNPLTVYGGSLDVVSGVLTVDRGYVDLGTLNWIVYQAEKGSFITYFADMKNNTLNALCSQYTVVANYTQWISSDKTFFKDINGRIYLRDLAYANVSANDFKTAMSGVQLVYELTTPQTYQLTPQQIKSLLGNNNAWCDTGDVNVKYNKDATTVINSLIARIEALENA